MSIKVMSAVYDSDLTDVYEVAVMLALANHADDSGVCYPSIPRIARLARMGERGVQGVIKRLSERGYLTVEMSAGRNGTNVYTVHATPAPHAPPPPHPMHPPHDVRPAPDAPPPPHPITQTPAPHAPETSRNVIQTSGASSRRLKDQEQVELLSEVLSNDAAEAFVANRRAMKKPMTIFAAKLMRDRLKKLPNAEAEALRAIRNGWQDVYPDKQRAPAAADKVERWNKMGTRS